MQIQSKLNALQSPPVSWPEWLVLWDAGFSFNIFSRAFAYPVWWRASSPLYFCSWLPSAPHGRPPTEF